MIDLKPKRTTESVAFELAEGLRNGTVALDSESHLKREGLPPGRYVAVRVETEIDVRHSSTS